jgi:CheY-like chemotaxis protein
MQQRVTNILLVEDDEVDVMNVKRAFKKHNINHPLYVASNGIQALDMLRNDRNPVFPHERRLILLDLNMPQMNGLEFLEELRSDPKLKFIPVIIMTTSNEERDRMEAYNFNVAGYILKPVTFENFASTMATLNLYWNLCEMV